MCHSLVVRRKMDPCRIITAHGCVHPQFKVSGVDRIFDVCCQVSQISIFMQVACIFARVQHFFSGASRLSQSLRQINRSTTDFINEQRRPIGLTKRR